MLLISVMALGLLLGLLGDFEMDEFESGGGVCLAALLGLLFFFALIAFAYLDKLLLRSRNKLHWIAPLGAGPLSLGGGWWLSVCKHVGWFQVCAGMGIVTSMAWPGMERFGVSPFLFFPGIGMILGSNAAHHILKQAANRNT